MTWTVAVLTLIMGVAGVYLIIGFMLVSMAIQFLHWTFLVAGIIGLVIPIVMWVRAKRIKDKG
jgi:hypothetical protein